MATTSISPKSSKKSKSRTKEDREHPSSGWRNRIPTSWLLKNRESFGFFRWTTLELSFFLIYQSVRVNCHGSILQNQMKYHPDRFANFYLIEIPLSVPTDTNVEQHTANLRVPRGWRLSQQIGILRQINATCLTTLFFAQRCLLPFLAGETQHVLLSSQNSSSFLVSDWIDCLFLRYTHQNCNSSSGTTSSAIKKISPWGGWRR